MLSQYTPKNLSYFLDKFPEVKTLMSQSDYISSCNFSMNFFPIVLNADNEIGMSQKVPLDAYFCVTQTTSGGVKFDKTVIYDTYTDSINISARGRYEGKLAGLALYIDQYLKEFGKDRNVSISIFMTRDRNVGFGYKSFWVTMLAYWLLLHTKQIKDTQRNPENKNKIMKIVKDIYTLVGTEKFKRGTFIAPLRYPEVQPLYFTNKKIVQVNTTTKNELPIDIIIINFGSEFERNITMRSIKDFHEAMKKNVQVLDGQYDDTYLNHFAYCLKAEFINDYETLLENPINEHSMQKLMMTIDRINHFARIIEGPNDMIEYIQKIILKQKKFANEYIGVMPLTSNQNSDNIMLIANKNKSRQTLEKIIAEIHKTYTCAIEYVSRIDKEYKNGIVIEQWRDRDIVLPQNQGYDCTVTTATGEKIFASYNTIQDVYHDYLIFDAITDKIYIGDRLVNSKILPSQTYCIALIRILFHNMNKRVKNSSLDVSAYSKSMNQLTGKILSPLKKYTKEVLGTAIDIQVTGSLHTFTVKGQSSDQKIIFIEKR